MTFLIFAVLSSTGNHLLFKSFGRYDVDLLTAITINYAVCVVIGLVSSMGHMPVHTLPGQQWFWFSILQGGLLIICFFLMGLTTRYHGVSSASLASRLSVVIPTIAAFILYSDTIGIFKAIGILLALTALYLSGKNQGTKQKKSPALTGLFPLLLFIGFGTHSTLIKFVQNSYLDEISYHSYVMAAFMAALMISLALLFGRVVRSKTAFNMKDLAAGMALGCVNYGSVYFLVKALSTPGWQSSQIFPTLSISVVGASAIFAYLIFKEKLTKNLTLAILAGIPAIILLNL